MGWEEVKASGDAAYKQQNYARACQLYTSILEQHGGEIDEAARLKVLGNRGLASQKQGLGAPAVEDAIAVLSTGGDAVCNVSNWYRLGISLLTAKLPAEAIEVLSVAIEIDPQNLDATTKLKKAKQAMRANSGVSGPFESVEKNSSFQQEVRKQIASCKSAREGIQSPKKGPHANGLGNGISTSPSDAKRPATPENEAHKAKRLSSSSSNSTAANAENRDANGAQQSESPSSPEQQAASFKASGADFYKQGRYAEAIKAYGTAIEHTPDNAVLYSNRALASLMHGDYMQALNDGKTALAKDPTFARGYHRTAKAYLTMGKFDQAKESFSQALHLDKNDQAAREGLQMIDRLNSHLEAGTIAYKEGDARQALWHADQAIRETSPACEPALFLKARSLASLGRFSEALQESRNLTFEGNPGSSEAFTARGEVLYLSGNMAMAEKNFQQVLRMDPDCSEARKALRQVRTINSAKEAGNEAFKCREWHKAIEQYTLAIDTDPLLKSTFMSQCYANRCAANLNLQLYEKAVEDADKAVELDETNVKAIHRRATANLKLQNFDAAVRDFEKVKDMSPEMPGITQSLKSAKVELKKSKRVDYYKLLGVSTTATTDEIKKAYKRAALKSHPDKVPQEEREAAEKRFQQINNGHALLTDENKRAKYDAGWSEEEISQGAQEGSMGGMGGFGAGGLDPEILAHLFGQQRGGMGGFGGFGGFPGGGQSRY